MIKKFLIISLLLIAQTAIADEGYVSPESYAVNESELLDYMDVPATSKPTLNDLDKPIKFKKNKKVKHSENYETTSDYETSTNTTDEKYKKRIMYKIAKWWVDQRYKREESHHGTKHEIKVKQRMEYEKQQQEKLEEQEKNENS